LDPDGFVTVPAGGKQPIPRPAEWTPGPTPSWLTTTSEAAPTSGEIVAAVPAIERPLTPAFAGARHSAVMIALADGPSGAEVLLTKRSMALTHHRGEISFPGGRMDPGETPLDTALREAHEEVGLEPSLVAPRGELDHLDTIVSRSYIVPIVATLPERVELAPTSPEVDRVWWVPVVELLTAGRYRSERWGRAPTDRVIHFFELDDETVWGATAHLLVELLAASQHPDERP
jgi:8-oxo-dGTP pyrophosphatase MutT (NUDIX family)